jgi:glycosyltransferase involved in cell wall biosynthesis
VAHLVVVSFRLGENDGVSVEAQKWVNAFGELGHRVTTLAGEGDADRVMPSLAINASEPVPQIELANALEDADLVVVENLVSLPLNVNARDALYRTLDGRRALFRHHDLPWQREQWRHDPAPRDHATWRHVTINELSRRELDERGIDAVTMYNSFDCAPPRGRRDETRKALGLSDERLVVMPTRAIPRKNVAGGLALAETLEATFWLLGPAEDGFDDELDALLARTRARVVRGIPQGFDIHDAYAASDLVVMPSTWEGFGNPVLESVTHRRPLAVYPYPVLRELREFGFHFFDLEDVAGVAEFLDEPHEGLFEHNAEIARRHFNVADLPYRLAPVLESVGIK